MFWFGAGTVQSCAYIFEYSKGANGLGGVYDEGRFLLSLCVCVSIFTFVPFCREEDYIKKGKGRVLYTPFR